MRELYGFEKEIGLGTVLKHYKGNIYRVYDLTNTASEKEDFPPSASYTSYSREGENNKYTRAKEILLGTKYRILPAATELSRILPSQRVTDPLFPVFNIRQADLYFEALQEIYEKDAPTEYEISLAKKKSGIILNPADTGIHAIWRTLSVSPNSKPFVILSRIDETIQVYEGNQNMLNVLKGIEGNLSLHNRDSFTALLNHVQE